MKHVIVFRLNCDRCHFGQTFETQELRAPGPKANPNGPTIAGWKRVKNPNWGWPATQYQQPGNARFIDLCPACSGLG